MAMEPRRIRQLKPALPAKDTDVFPVSQMEENGVATTRAMTREQNNAEMIAVINAARQEFVDSSNQEHADIRTALNALQERVNNNEISDSNIATAIAMVQQMIASGDGGKSAYQLWLDLPGNSGKSVQQFFDAMTGPPGTTDWNSLLNKPTSYTPSQHTHALVDIVGLEDALNSKAPKTHAHNEGDVTGLSDKLDEIRRQATTPAAWGDVTGKPEAFPPASHKHPASDITGLPSAPTVLGELDVVDRATVALLAGVRSVDVTVPATWGMRTTDTLFATPAAALPVGYAIDNALPLSATSVRVYFVGPNLALLAVNTLKVRIAAIARA